MQTRISTCMLQDTEKGLDVQYTLFRGFQFFESALEAKPFVLRVCSADDEMHLLL